MAKITYVTIDDCHVNTTYGEHGFRVYANNLTLTNSTACNTNKSGLWVVEGRTPYISGFQSSNYLRIGPNYLCQTGAGPEKGERVIGAVVENVNVHRIEVEPGTIGCYLSDIKTQTTTESGLSIGRGTEGVPRPLNRIHWKLHPDSPNKQVNLEILCNGTDISSCVGDIDDDEDVDVNDLLAVIGMWGPCPPPAIGACWINRICHSDFTQAACTANGGVYQGDGTDCWTNPASGPCCTLSGTWTCSILPPSGCWNAAGTREYHGNQSSCPGSLPGYCGSGSTLPACNAPCLMPPTICAYQSSGHSSDIMPEARGNGVVDVNDLLRVIGQWGPCANPVSGPPESVDDCFDIYCAGLEGEEWQSCIDRCLQAYCSAHPEECD